MQQHKRGSREWEVEISMTHSKKYSLAGMGLENGFVAGAVLRMPIKCLLDLGPVQAASSGALICFSPGEAGR